MLLHIWKHLGLTGRNPPNPTFSISSSTDRQNVSPEISLNIAFGARCPKNQLPMFDLPLFLVSIKGRVSYGLWFHLSTICGGKKRKTPPHWKVQLGHKVCVHFCSSLNKGVVNKSAKMMFALPGQWDSLVLTGVRSKLSSEWVITVPEWPGLPLEATCFQILSCHTRKEIWGEQMEMRGKQKHKIPGKRYQ